MNNKNGKPIVSIIYFPGTNCEIETMEAFRNAGGKPQLLLWKDIGKKGKQITDCDLVCFVGGFSFGDHIDTGVIAATMIKEHVPLLISSGTPVLGICNGFQQMVRAGMFGKGVTLTTNDSHTFCSRPMDHYVKKSNCIWTEGLEGKILSFPAAHGGGKVICSQTPNIVLTYAQESPNGGKIAGIASHNGLMFGLMDHPERRPDNPDGQLIFRNGIKAVS